MGDVIPGALPPVVPDRVFSWLMRLHALCAGSSTRKEAEARVGLVAPLLMQRFSPAAFTDRSLEHVAVACTFWPAYAELAGLLAEWWRRNLPVPVAIAAPPPAPAAPPLSSEEREAMAARFAEQRAQLVAELAGRRVEVAEQRDRDAAVRAASLRQVEQELQAHQVARGIVPRRMRVRADLVGGSVS